MECRQIIFPGMFIVPETSNHESFILNAAAEFLQKASIALFLYNEVTHRWAADVWTANDAGKNLDSAARLLHAESFLDNIFKFSRLLAELSKLIGNNVLASILSEYLDRYPKLSELRGSWQHAEERFFGKKKTKPSSPAEEIRVNNLQTLFVMFDGGAAHYKAHLHFEDNDLCSVLGENNVARLSITGTTLFEAIECLHKASGCFNWKGASRLINIMPFNIEYNPLGNVSISHFSSLVIQG